MLKSENFSFCLFPFSQAEPPAAERSLSYS
jgi:hypothetical protein